MLFSSFAMIVYERIGELSFLMMLMFLFMFLITSSQS